MTGLPKPLWNDDPASIGEHWRRFTREPFCDAISVIDEAVFSVFFDSVAPIPQTVVEAWKEVCASHLKRAHIGDFHRYAPPDTVEVHVGIL